jgi:hypothetical protein
MGREKCRRYNLKRGKETGKSVKFSSTSVD